MQLDRWQLISHSPVLHLEVTLASCLSEYPHIIFPNNFRAYHTGCLILSVRVAALSWDQLFSKLWGDLTLLFIQIMTFNNYPTHPGTHTGQFTHHPAQPGFLKSENFSPTTPSSRSWTQDQACGPFWPWSFPAHKQHPTRWKCWLETSRIPWALRSFGFRFRLYLLSVSQAPELPDQNQAHWGIWDMKCWPSIANPICWQCWFMGQGQHQKPKQEM